ncbi:TPA: hypothetical protein EYP44_01985, partial [Candidatus Bathyarchaeota archaeon]|nr:hypothetical protein [Candidatus Bathyarchaeota archaeon]
MGVLNQLPLFMVTLPIVGWVATRGGVERLRDAYAVMGLLVGLIFLRPLYSRVLERGVLVIPAVYAPPMGACLEIDMLGVFMALVALTLGVLASAYSVRYMERDTGLTTYYTLVLAMVAGMVGVYFAGDFFTL